MSHSLDSLAVKFSHTDFARVRADQTIDQAICSLRMSPLSSRVVYFYVLDQDERLVGVLPVRRLLLSLPDQLISEVMLPNVVSLPATSTIREVSELFLARKLLALPLVDEERRVAGVIDVDQLTNEMRSLDDRNHSQEIFQLIGMRLTQDGNFSLWQRWRDRFPWLLCNIAGGLSCAFIAGWYEESLQAVIAISLFIPVVLALAESVSIQSLTIALEACQGKAPPWQRLMQVVGREMMVGLSLGACAGLLIGLVAGGWQQNLMLAGCLFASVSLCVTLAATLGLLIPSLFAAFRIDPRVASGPLTLAVVDSLTMLCYLGIASRGLA